MRRHLLFLMGALLAAAVMPPGLGAQEPSTPGATKAALVNLNTATVAELEKLPGIGTRTAERIVEYREKNGSFKKIEELMNVRGIGEKSFLKLKPLITVAQPQKGTSAPSTPKS